MSWNFWGEPPFWPNVYTLLYSTQDIQCIWSLEKHGKVNHKEELKSRFLSLMVKKFRTNLTSTTKVVLEAQL